MDPFSILTGSLTVLGACATVSRTFSRLHGLKSAPALLQALNNEISDLQLALMDMNDYIRSAKTTISNASRSNRIILQRCSYAVNRIKDKVLEVDKLLQYEVLKAGRECSYEINIASFLKEQKRLGQLQMDLRDARQQIAGLFSHLDARHTVNVSQVVSELRSVALRNRAEVLTGLSTMTQHQIGLSDGQTRMEEGQARILETLRTLMARQSAISELSGPVSAQESSSSAQGTIRVSVARTWWPTHRSRCPCSNQGTSANLQSCLGRLFVGYAATPIFRGRGRSRCRCEVRAEVVLTYLFPIWFLHFVLLMHARFSLSGGLICSLNIRQTLSLNHIIYDLIRVGDTMRMEELFRSGRVSLQSQDELGMGLLHHAIGRKNAQSVRLLLQLGADPYYDPMGPYGSPYRAVWAYIFRLKGSLKWRKEMETLFPKPDFDDLFNFSVLHYAILGIPGCNLESVVQDSNVDINISDSWGEFPLLWAASRGDFNALGLLLAHGASCNEQNVFGHSALMRAAPVSKRCVDLLLAAEADARIHNDEHSTALHWAAEVDTASESVDILKSLVNAGADINVQNVYGETALMCASQWSNQKGANYLIAAGTNLRLFDTSGNNALCWATRANNHSTIEHLIKEGADHSSKLERYHTFMHLVAERADLTTLRLLTRGSLAQRDINIRNQDKLTPMQISWQRQDVGAEWQEAFVDFLKSIDQDYSRDGGARGVDTEDATDFEADRWSSDDEYEDAVEFRCA